MRKKAKILLISYLSVLILALGLYAWAGQWGLSWYRRTANESASLAYEETVRSVQALSGVLAEAPYATDSEMCDRICCEAYACAAAAESAMSTLPFSTWELEELSAFLNTAGDYAHSLCGQGRPFTERQRQELRALADRAAEFSGQLLTLRDELHTRDLRMDSREKRLRNVGADPGAPLSGELLRYEAGFAPISLQYDGAYSDREETRSGGLLTEAEMLAAAADFAGVPESELRQEALYENANGRRCYRTGDVWLCVGRSGVESMSCSRLVGEETLSMDQARQAAKDFLLARGYSETELLEEAQSACLAQFTFARVQDGALCPDSVLRLSIALDDGTVYSFDAADYDARPLEVTWTLEEESARAALPEGLKVKDSRAVILRSPGGLAVPCYAFSCRDADGRAVEICVSAETGKQVRISVSA